MFTKSIKIISITVLLFLSFSLFGLSQKVIALDCNNPATPQEAIKCGACGSSGVGCNEKPEDPLNNTIANVVNLLSTIVGILAVIMIIIAGFRYVTSGGKQENVTAAKNTIIYAVIGLVIVVIAQLIVHFVLTKVENAGNNTPGTTANP